MITFVSLKQKKCTVRKLPSHNIACSYALPYTGNSTNSCLFFTLHKYHFYTDKTKMRFFNFVRKLFSTNYCQNIFGMSGKNVIGKALFAMHLTQFLLKLTYCLLQQLVNKQWSLTYLSNLLLYFHSLFINKFSN